MLLLATTTTTTNRQQHSLALLPAICFGILSSATVASPFTILHFYNFTSVAVAGDVDAAVAAVIVVIILIDEYHFADFAFATYSTYSQLPCFFLLSENCISFGRLQRRSVTQALNALADILFCFVFCFFVFVLILLLPLLRVLLVLSRSL